jgi:hypothetical protein
MREIRLLTETSTQIRVSVQPKARLRPTEGEQKMIAGSLHSGKCFYRKEFPLRKSNHDERSPSHKACKFCDQALCYD